MLDSIIFDLNLYFALVPLSFTSAFILYKFAMLLDVYILLSPQEEEVPSSSCGNRRTHLAAHSSKIRPFVCHYISMPQ